MTTIDISALPAPRLELRWSKAEGQEAWGHSICQYGLVMPLREHDIRRESWKTEDIMSENDEVFYVFGTTKVTRSETRTPYDSRMNVVDTPFRDGAHALWDANILNNLPIFATCEGKATKIVDNPRK